MTFTAHAGWTRSVSIAEATAWWIAQITRPDPKLLRLAAVLNDDIVGYVDFYDDETMGRELGFLIGPSRRWGHGLGQAAAEAGLAYGFGPLSLPRIWAEAVDANQPSVRILQRLGMLETGTGQVETFLGKPSHFRRFEISRTEWAQRSSSASRRS